MRGSAVVGLSAAAALVALALWAQFYVSFRHHLSARGVAMRRRQQQQPPPPPQPKSAAVSATHAAANASSSTVQREEEDRCAICLFGLPRAFASLVLPSLSENVIKVNARHRCDYFVHYYNVTYEPSSRSGSGGRIDPEEVLSLEAEVRRVSASLDEGPLPHRPPAVAHFASETSDDFWRRRGALVDKVRSANDTEGRFLYFPWRDKTYHHPTTTDNILKMWHSIQESWGLMQAHSAATTGADYRRVAMLRSDVLYVTPIDVWALPWGGRDSNNSVAVIPGFSRYPVSDRLIYGPWEAVKIWAAERFDRMEDHVRWTLANNPGMGLHSETFVRRALLEPIRGLGIRVEAHPTLCFVRARADESLWIKDCERSALKSVKAGLVTFSVQARVEALLRRTCQVRPTLSEMDCPRIRTNATSADELK